MNTHHGNALGGKAVAELFIEQRVRHGSGQEHGHWPARTAAPHGQHDWNLRRGDRHLLIALRVLYLIAQPLISVAHTNHLNQYPSPLLIDPPGPGYIRNVGTQPTVSWERRWHQGHKSCHTGLFDHIWPRERTDLGTIGPSWPSLGARTMRDTN